MLSGEWMSGFPSKLEDSTQAYTKELEVLKIKNLIEI